LILKEGENMKRYIRAILLMLTALLSAVLLSGCALYEVMIVFEDDGSVQYTNISMVEENFLEDHGTTVEEAFDVEDRDELLCDTYNGYDFYGKPDVSSIKNFESVDAFAEAMEDDRVTHLIINDDGTYSLVFVIPAQEDMIEDSGDLTERDKENLAWRARFVCPTSGWVTRVEVEGSEEAESALSMDLESHGGVTNIVMTMPVLTEAYQVWVTVDPVLEGTYIHEIWLDFVIPQPGSSMAGALSQFHLDDDADGLDLGAAEITWMEAVKTGDGSLSPTVYLPITDPDYKFEAGKQYAYQIDVPAKEGFLLAHDPFVYENGRKTSTFEKTPFSITINSNGSFPVGCTTLRQVSITSAAPVPGMTVSELRSSITVAADQDAIVPPYSVELWLVMWNQAEKSWDWEDELSDDYRIEPGENYALYIEGSVSEGFIVEKPVTSFSFNRGEISGLTITRDYSRYIVDCVYGTGYPGDIDLDGEVDSQNLTALARHVAKISELESGAPLQNADVTGDGVVDAQDLTKLARFVAQIITEL
jgi:hypothetical protein